MSDFEDIRPYHDHEVPATVSKLLRDAEFIDSMAAFSLPGLHQAAPWLAKPLVKAGLYFKAGNIRTVHDFQMALKPYLLKTINRTTSGLSISGLEHLTENEPHLFISNHRDIAMDPAFVNLALEQNGHQTMRIAIGDNLLQKPFTSDLMRLNKSFIVNRSATGVREKMAAYLSLSSYISQSIAEGESIWIAQREGRAKDGIDRTEPAIIKMLYMSQKKSGVVFQDYIKQLKVVPVTLSYEYNPCDALVARELHAKATTGEYQKQPGEDLQSIVAGITGHKGHVHVAFGAALTADLENPEQVANAIDQQMRQNYRLHPSNHIAAAIRNNETGDLAQRFGEKAAEFEARLAPLDEALRPFMLDMYANPAAQSDSAAAS